MKTIVLTAILLCGGQSHQSDAIRLTIDDIPNRPTLVYPVIPISGRIATQEGEWKEPPSILLCPDGPVTVRPNEPPKQYWQRLHYTFGPIMHALPGSQE